MPDVRIAAARDLRLDRRATLAAAGLLLLARPMAQAAAWEASAREAMVATIEDHAGQAGSALGRTTIDPRVLEVMRRVPRHAFVPAEEAAHAYEDRPLPIGHGQTISQPFIVALMTDLLRTAPEHVVLEVGTGSGYQAAVLAELVRQVHSDRDHPAAGRSGRAAPAGPGLPQRHRAPRRRLLRPAAGRPVRRRSS